MVSWLCKAPSLEDCLVNWPSPASPFTKLSFSFSRLAPATHPICLLGYLPFPCRSLFYSFPIYCTSYFTSQKYKEGSFIFSFLKKPMQDKALLNRMCPTACSYSQHLVATAPVPSHGAPITACHILRHHDCIHHSLTPYAEGKQLRFFLLLSLQQTTLGNTAILIKSLGKYTQILAEFYIKPLIFDRCVTETW